MNLLILGAGEYGQLVKELARNQYTTIDFLDDNSSIAIEKLDAYKSLNDRYQDAVVAIGNNEIRMYWIEKLEEAGYNLPILVPNRACISSSAIVGSGCIVESMATINANALVEKGSILSSGSVVNHNAVVKQGCHIDCNSVVGANAIVPEKMHLHYGQIFTKVSKPKDWEFSE